MRRHNIVLGMVSDAPIVPKGEQWIFDDWAAADADRFLFGYYIRDPADISIADLRALILAGEIHGIGELGFQYNEIPIDDAAVAPFFALADELDVSVHVHLGGLGRGDTFPIHLGTPRRLSQVLRRHPTLRVYVENASFPYLAEIVAVVLRYPNVYMDISTMTWALPRTTVHTYLRSLVEYGLIKRIMFGSDQMMWPEAISVAVETIETADFLTAADKRDIFYNNAARFLRLSEEQIARHHGTR
jgi:hypothetical protein